MRNTPSERQAARDEAAGLENEDEDEAEEAERSEGGRGRSTGGGSVRNGGSSSQDAGRLTICHVPPGNDNARRTITIDEKAWPAHKGHCSKNGRCDAIGGCQ